MVRILSEQGSSLLDQSGSAIDCFISSLKSLSNRVDIKTNLNACWRWHRLVWLDRRQSSLI